jgi:hypothetical protein
MLLNTHSVFVGNGIGGNSLNENVMLKSRDELEGKMAAVFGEEIKELSTELREILIDDLVTAFENRVNVLNRIQVGRRFR